MKKLLFIVFVLISFYAKAQTPPTGFTYRKGSEAILNLSGYNSFGLPQDTFSIASTLKSLRWMANKGDSLYMWSVILQKWIIAGGGGGAAATTFTSLTDGPGSYTGKSLNYIRVNTGETALEYRTPANVLSDIGAQGTLVSGTNIKTVGSVSLLGSGDVAFKTLNSTSLVGSGNLLLSDIGAQATLVSGTNIKTFNGSTLLGSGNVAISTVNGSSLVASGNIITDYSVQAMAALGSAIKGQTVGQNITTIVSSVALADNQARFVPVWIPQDATVTGVKWFQGTQGNYTADFYNGVALYSYSAGNLTLVDTTDNDGNIWKATGNAWASKAFHTTHAITAGLYFIAYMYNSSAVVSGPTIGGTAAYQANAYVTVDFTNSAKWYSLLTASAMPAPTQAMSGLTSTTANPHYFIVY